MRGWAASILGAALLAGAPARATCALTRVAELPVVMDGMKPMVEAGINGQRLRFILDSGAFFSLVAPAAAARLGLGRTPLFGVDLAGIGGRADADLTTVRELQVGGAVLPSVQFIIGGNLPGVAGLFGQNLLGYRDAEYDLAHGAVRLIQARGCAGLDFAYWANNQAVAVLPMAPRTREEPLVHATVAVNGQPVRALFDTGADVSALTLAAARRLGVRLDDPAVRAEGLSHGIGRGTARTWVAPFASLTIGGERIERIRLRVIDATLPEADLILGADFFLSHRVYVANAAHRILLTYNGGPVFDLRPAAAADAAGAAAR